MSLPVSSDRQRGSDDEPSFADQGASIPQRKANIDRHMQFYDARVNALTKHVDKQIVTVRGVRDAFKRLPDRADVRTCKEASGQDLQCPVHSSVAAPGHVTQGHSITYDCSVRARRHELQTEVEKTRESGGRIHEDLEWCEKRCSKIKDTIIQLAQDEGQWQDERHNTWIIAGLSGLAKMERMVAMYDRFTKADVDQVVADEEFVEDPGKRRRERYPITDMKNRRRWYPIRASVEEPVDHARSPIADEADG
ncbi:hypothetical protein BDV97DRAFT_370406 [Delphinella strobiligena]|nr:hypothetical protein BDV97DRAFT_370406 [Delphinella strobiligena]